MLDGRQHGEGQHHQRDVAVPAVPRPGLVVVEAELVLRRLERVLDGPAPALDGGQRLDRGPGRAPGGEVGALAIGGVAPDLLDRPADEVRRVRVSSIRVFGGGGAFARWRMVASMAKASITSDT